MLRRSISIFFVGMLLAGCEFFSPSGDASTASTTQQIDTVIDYSKVDVYPIFYDCEDYSEDNDQKKCFESSLSGRLSELLNKTDLKVRERVNETTNVKLFIDNSGKATVNDIFSTSKIKEQLPMLDSIIRASVATLPTVKPAVKRGIFVNSEYTLAIIIKTI